MYPIALKYLSQETIIYIPLIYNTQINYTEFLFNDKKYHIVVSFKEDHEHLYVELFSTYSTGNKKIKTKQHQRYKLLEKPRECSKTLQPLSMKLSFMICVD